MHKWIVRVKTKKKKEKQKEETLTDEKRQRHFNTILEQIHVKKKK